MVLKEPQQNLAEDDEQRCSCRKLQSSFLWGSFKFLKGATAPADTGAALLLSVPEVHLVHKARAQILNLHHPASPRSYLNHCKIGSQLTIASHSSKSENIESSCSVLTLVFLFWQSWVFWRFG